MIDPSVVVRAIEFATSILIAGEAVFSLLVAEPAWGKSNTLRGPWPALYRKQISSVVWSSLCLTVASGATRLVLLAADISGASWIEVIGDGTAWTVLTETQFGIISQLRVLLAAGIAGLLLLSVRVGGITSIWLRVLITLAAASLLGLLAWTGHASGGSGAGANVHLLSDVMHLVAAGAWVGGLVPLALLMRQVSRTAHPKAMLGCAHLLHRFSNLGALSVAILFASGLINTWYLTDHFKGLIGTEYGRLLQIKIALFLAMLCLAAINRFRLLKGVALRQDPSNIDRNALRQLQRNTSLEIALGFGAIIIAAGLGAAPPAGHVH